MSMTTGSSLNIGYSVHWCRIRDMSDLKGIRFPIKHNEVAMGSLIMFLGAKLCLGYL